MDFSVIIPAYNVSSIVERAVRSAAVQTFRPLEILVIDDCSTDDTVDVVRALAREIPSLRLLSTQANGGPSVARNVGLREAKGDWIALLDADDLWKPDRLKRLSEVARATSADFVADNLVMWDAVADRQFKPAHFELLEAQMQVTLLDVFRADDNFNFSKATFAIMKPICRRKFLTDRKIKYNEDLRVGEDFILLAEILLNGAKIILVEEAYYIYSMPSGPSGRSAHSRTVYNVSALPDACDMLSRKYGARIDGTLKRAMDNYRKTMTRLYESDVARSYRRSGQYGRFFAYLVVRPDLSRRLIVRTAIRMGTLLRQTTAR